jgi:acyl-coenzyme A thioesterase PaaI-like protein
MTRRSHAVQHPDASAIRAQVLRGLAANRTPGFHFPGHFLGVSWPRIGEEEIEEAMPDGPHCRDADGGTSLVALAVLLDTALATAPRLEIERGARQGTVQIHAQFTGVPAGGALTARARLAGFTTGAIRQALTRGAVFSAGRPVCYASGTFVVLPPPPGVTLAPLPWQREKSEPVSPLEENELRSDERSIMKACESALERADGKHGFIEHFWDALPRATRYGARCAIRIGPQHGNRVGHVQGGLLFGLAAVTARAAAARHPQLSAVSAWFVKPGEGSRLDVRSRLVHAGRSFAVVRTEVTARGGTRVLEVLSNHAA